MGCRRFDYNSGIETCVDICELIASGFDVSLATLRWDWKARLKKDLAVDHCGYCKAGRCLNGGSSQSPILASR